MPIRYKVISDDTDFGFDIELRPWYVKWCKFKKSTRALIDKIRMNVRKVMHKPDKVVTIWDGGAIRNFKDGKEIIE
jgi:hypothetical protein